MPDRHAGLQVCPVSTERSASGRWPSKFAPGTYKLQFDMAGYPDAKAAPFFPEIDPVFRITDSAAHYDVPVVVSPFGYSTYRGN